MSCDANCMQRQIELDGTESNIEILSELRAQFNCFDKQEEPVYRALSDAISALKGWWSYPLPAQPNLQPTCNQLATDSISRQEAIRAYCENQCGKGMIRGECGCDDCGTIFDDIPSAQPEIIRCKDCKYGGMKEFEEGYCGGGAIDQEITGMDYCSWAERRTDGKTDRC